MNALTNKIRKIIRKWRNFSMVIFVSITTSSAWANLPTPPTSDVASDTKDWEDVGQTLLFKVLGIACIALGAIALAGVVAGVIKAYHTAHERQDLGHFFKMLIVGLLVAALSIGLLYSAYEILNSSS